MQSLHEGPAEPSGRTDLESGWCFFPYALGAFFSEVALIGWQMMLFTLANLAITFTSVSRGR